tara:strand:+ start:137 stop:346 length:210 start_codon:yes stop_codon:yes gene_type:complete
VKQMQEIKFILQGQHRRPNGHVMNDSLSYITATKEDAVATCNRLNPYFHIDTVTVDESEVEVVGFQSLI